MVTYFNRKDLVDFGNYLLSEKRKARILEAYHSARKDGMNLPEVMPPHEGSMVNHADYCNWMEEKQHLKKILS